jgi:hypothetical protein
MSYIEHQKVCVKGWRWHEYYAACFNGSECAVSVDKYEDDECFVEYVNEMDTCEKAKQEGILEQLEHSSDFRDKTRRLASLHVWKLWHTCIWKSWQWQEFKPLSTNCT